MYFLNLLLFTQPSAVNETATICVVSAVFILSESHQLPLRSKFVKEEGQESRRLVNTFKLSKDSTFIYDSSLQPKMFTRPRQDANDSLFALQP